MPPADRNRVQSYLQGQRGEDFNVLDANLFVRDLTDPSTSDDDVKRVTDEMTAAGKSPLQIGQEVLGAGQKELVKSFTQRRTDAMKQYTDANAKSKAVSDAETGGQTVARILADMANAYAGGKPGEITAMIKKHRETERTRADKLAGDTLAFELEGIEGERGDARSRATLQASANEKDAVRTFTAGQNELQRNQQRDIETQRTERLATQRSEDQRLAREKEERAQGFSEQQRQRTVADTRQTGQQNDLRDAKQKRSDKVADLTLQTERAAGDVEAELAYMAEEIKRNGTMEWTGDFEKNMAAATSRIATSLAKLADPATAAMSGEVQREAQNLFQPGFWQTEATVLSQIETLRQKIAEKKERGLGKIREYETYGFPDEAKGAPPSGVAAPGAIAAPPNVLDALKRYPPRGQ